MDSLLRRSMAAPIPNLSPDFDQRLLREARRSSQALSRYGQILFTGYGLLSAVASAVVMRVQGLGWPAIAMTMLGSVALLATPRLFRRPSSATARLDAR